MVTRHLHIYRWLFSKPKVFCFFLHTSLSCVLSEPTFPQSACRSCLQNLRRSIDVGPPPRHLFLQREENAHIVTAACNRGQLQKQLRTDVNTKSLSRSRRRGSGDGGVSLCADQMRAADTFTVSGREDRTHGTPTCLTLLAGPIARKTTPSSPVKTCLRKENAR